MPRKPIIIWCKFFFLFIGRKPTTWPANNCLKIMVCSCRNVAQLCLAANNILRMRKRNLAFLLLAIVLAWKKADRFASRRWSLKKQTWWSNDKTIIKLGYRKISRFASVSYINYLPQPSASANNNLLATDKSRYFAQPRPIIVICPIARKQVDCVIGLVHSVLYVSDRQVKYSAGSQITEVF